VLLAAPAMVTSGATVVVTGSVTEDGARVADIPVEVDVTDAADWTPNTVTTTAAGTFSLPVKIETTTTVTAYTTATQSQTASVKITAVAAVALTLPANVARPYLLDPATVHLAPAGYATYALQYRPLGATTWTTATDGGGFWAKKPGKYQVRAVVTTSGGLTAAGVSPIVAVTVKNGAVPSWLRTLNSYRALNNAGPVAENPVWSKDDALHVRYMEKTGDFSHTEDPKSKWYTKQGAQAGEASDLCSGCGGNSVAVWATAPYHALSEVSRWATLAGYAQGAGYAALWVSDLSPQRTYSGPAYQYPANGRTTSLLAYSGGEEPDPLSTCPAAWKARGMTGLSTGLPIIFSDQAKLTKPAAKLTTGKTALRVCVVAVYGYAVFLIPLYPLLPRHSYTATVTYAGKTQSHWTFKTS